MLKDLVKLADYLDDHNKTKLADEVDQLIQKFAGDKTDPLPFLNNRIDPISAPKTRRRDLGDITGEFDRPEEGTMTEIMDPAEMIGQHKPTRGMLEAINQTLSRFDQGLDSIEWHIPGYGPGASAHEADGDPPYWFVISKPLDPAEMPYNSAWAFWEVSPDDENWEAGVDIPGKSTRMYGEW